MICEKYSFTCLVVELGRVAELWSEASQTHNLAYFGQGLGSAFACAFGTASQYLTQVRFIVEVCVDALAYRLGDTRKVFGKFLF